jgi:hypothetical protein
MAILIKTLAGVLRNEVRPVELPPPDDAGKFNAAVQAIVGGYYEAYILGTAVDVDAVVSNPSDFMNALNRHCHNVYMLANEDAGALGLPVNYLASKVYSERKTMLTGLPVRQVILGDVLIVTGVEMGEE